MCQGVTIIEGASIYKATLSTGMITKRNNIYYSNLIEYDSDMCDYSTT
jgi:hypothetical protein